MTRKLVVDVLMPGCPVIFLSAQIQPDDIAAIDAALLMSAEEGR